MKRITISLMLLLCATTLAAQSLWDATHLAEVKQSPDDPCYAEAYAALIAEAERLTEAEPLSVMMKERTPAGGTKHDYMSLARYFWPNPDTPDGLPYVNRDGISNPEIEQYDRNRLGITAERISTLSLAWYLSGDERYARKATELIRVWFLDRATQMNPHFRYAQVALGHDGDLGRCYGILDGYSFVEMLEGVRLLETSEAFPAADRRRLKSWFAQLLRWMVESPQGAEEAAAANNHGTAYDVQVVAYALYTGDTELARTTLEALPARRIFTQIEPDGRQPHELTRTRAFGYSQYNLSHLIDLCILARQVGLAPERTCSDDGRCLEKGLDFLAQYLDKEAEAWPYEELGRWEECRQALCRDLYRAATRLDLGRDYLALWRRHRIADPRDHFILLHGRPTLTDRAYAAAERQLRYAMQCVDSAKREEANAARRLVSPRTLNPDGSLALVHPHDWCSGFFAGSLWHLYAYNGDPFWREQAISYTWPIEEAKLHGGTHDLGFMLYDSFGKAWELTGERSYRDVVLRSARTLISRFDPRVGCIRSWDHNRERWRYPVIIDNLMNLELLFRAAQETGDTLYRHVAVRHADVTLRNHFRPDASSYHVVDYDPETGEVRMKCTAQGYADDSFWSRGQGWGLYGYTMCYRFTRDPAYLEQAVRIAEFILSWELPDDGIPYWDMKAPDIPEAPRDASAAAVIASGLYELCTYVDADAAARYRAFADRTVEALYDGYRAEPESHAGFLLLHSTGHLPAGSEIDVPLSYADYYYLEALARREALEYGLPIGLE